MADIEFAEPTARARRKFVVLFITGAVVAALLALVVRPRLLEFIKGLPACDQSRWAVGALVVCFSVLPIAAAAAILYARKLLRFNQSPLPNAQVWRRTRIRRGRPVRVQAYTLFAYGVGLLALALYLLYLFRPMLSIFGRFCGA